MPEWSAYNWDCQVQVCIYISPCFCALYLLAFLALPCPYTLVNVFTLIVSFILPIAASAWQGPLVPDGTGQIWLDEVECLGTESNIFQCGNMGLGVHNCEHREDAGVSCTGA